VSEIRNYNPSPVAHAKEKRRTKQKNCYILLRCVCGNPTSHRPVEIGV